MLGFDSNLSKMEVLKIRSDIEMRWFTSICDIVTTKAVNVQLHELPDGLERCREIEETLTAIMDRTQILTVYLDTSRGDRRKRFPKLYRANIVTDNQERF